MDNPQVLGETGELKAPAPSTNRSERRSKGRRLTIADIRGFRARLLLDKLYGRNQEK